MDSTVASGKSFGAIKDFAVLALGNARILARKNPYAPATMMGLKGDGPGRCERGIGDTTGTVPFGEERQAAPSSFGFHQSRGLAFQQKLN